LSPNLQYLGGRIPADISPESAALIEDLIHSTCKTIPGLKGYLGIDLLLPEAGTPLVVEINPRVTTSYVGYRRLCRGTIARRLLSSVAPALACKADLEWHSEGVTFLADGQFA
jgi:predicted ATP-grasp superfamily ATP-dependent carboligase